MKITKKIKDNCDIFFFIIVIGALNAHLVGFFEPESLILLPEAVKEGEWWRLVTHPFVHVSWYHLTLDAGAFLALYSALEKKNGLRFSQTLICGIASFVAVWFCSATVSEIGFCGLSGLAHGLMILLSLEMLFDSKPVLHTQKSRAGLFVFTIIMVKCCGELTGRELMSSLYFGLCGNPVYESHIGGVMGGIVSFFILKPDETTCDPCKLSRIRSLV